MLFLLKISCDTLYVKDDSECQNILNFRGDLRFAVEKTE